MHGARCRFSDKSVCICGIRALPEGEEVMRLSGDEVVELFSRLSVDVVHGAGWPEIRVNLWNPCAGGR